ncbi:MAG: hypothetical protein IIU14_06975 [Ruminococcus sp.]|nr:hypothetical protein [Ruminococcus sp.]
MNLLVLLGAMICAAGVFLLVLTQLVLRKKMKELDKNWTGGDSNEMS